MKAIILVGGEGTRLRPLTYSIVKSMVPVLNRPFIEHVIRNLSSHGVDEVVLAMGYKPDSIYAYFKDRQAAGVRLTYSLEDKPLGTAGAVKNAASHVDGTFFVLNGDTFSDIDYGDMLKQHRKNKSRATIALAEVEDPTRFGVVETDKNGRVKAFIEKPSRDRITSNWINAGVYLLEPDVLDRIPVNDFYMFERGVFPGMLLSGEPIYAYHLHGYWIDMGNPAQYKQVNFDILSGKCQSPDRPARHIAIGEGSNIHPSVQFTGQVLVDRDCTIDEDTEMRGPVILGSGCRIGKQSLISNSILWDNVSIGEGTQVLNSVIVSGANIDNGTVMQDTAFNPAAPPAPDNK
jgi:mannose-1-phosphate guanylyltransferase